MKPLKNTLYKQLLSIGALITGIIFITLGLLLPKVLAPIYEKSIYDYLSKPLDFIGYNFENQNINSDIAYLYVKTDGNILTSSNIKNVIKEEPKQILKQIKNENGKFYYQGRLYYYYTTSIDNISKIAITNDEYLNHLKKDVLYTIFPILLFALIFISTIILLWSRNLISKIEHLKQKVDNLDNDDYIDNYNYDVDDELKVLSQAIDNMKENLKKQEEYKNQMYQNISHDFKTPLTVIKSYIEATYDGTKKPEDSLAVIKEQVDKLELKVHSLLYLNKLNYFKDSNNTFDMVDIKDVISKSVSKFKVIRKDIKWQIKFMDSNLNFRGTFDIWETIIDNLLNNFMRYAKSSIKITIKNGKITLYNDGPNIDEELVNDIFTPYRKGINGQFGLGLSIVSKSTNLLGYEISVKNTKSGVSFIIK